jgi:hypothetical protein
MASAVNVGSLNLPKMMRQLSHRTSQVRDLTFIRDAVYNKEYKTTKSDNSTQLSGPPVSFGYESSSTTTASYTKAQDSGTVTHSYTSTPEIVLPGLKMLQSPIVSRSGKLERTGHRVSGACTFYAPSLDYIKALTNFTDTVAFSELESYDKLIDIERIIQHPADLTADGDSADLTIDLSPGSTFPAGYEIDRLQFKIKITTDNLTSITLTGIDPVSTPKTMVWAATDTFTPTDWVTIDLPVKDVSLDNDDKTTQEVYIGGAGKTFTATSTLDIDRLKGGDNTSYLSNLIIATSGSASVELRDIYLYKEAEWRIEGIKEYRDEYMQISAARIRGDRASRRRTYG